MKRRVITILATIATDALNTIASDPANPRTDTRLKRIAQLIDLTREIVNDLQTQRPPTTDQPTTNVAPDFNLTWQRIARQVIANTKKGDERPPFVELVTARPEFDRLKKVKRWKKERK